MVDDIILLNYIDSGCFAEIYLSKKQDSDMLYATKKIDLKYISVEPLFKTHLNSEINFLKEMNHNNIIKLYDVKVTKENIYLIMEYCNGGSLKKALNNYKQKFGKPFTEDIVQYLMKQILTAVEYLHNHGIIHRDLKLENILLKYDNGNENEQNNLNFFMSQIKIIDFNISSRSQKFEKNIKKPNEEFESNIYETVDEKVDIWYLGLLCYEMLTGEKLFPEGYNIKHLYGITLPQNISLSAQTFLLSMLQINKEKRLSATQLLKHEFIIKNTNMLEIPSEFDTINNNTINNNTSESDTLNNNTSEFDTINNSSKKTINKIPNIMSTPMDNYKKRAVFSKDELRLSARVSHRRLPSLFHENTEENVNKDNKKSLPVKKEPVKPKKYICKINIVGKNINSNQLKIVIDSCIKTYLLMNGKITTANKSANLIKKLLGNNWLVFISNINNKDFDFCLSPGKKEDFISFVFCEKLFQIYRYS